MSEKLFSQTSAALRKAALNEEAKAYVLANPVLFNLLKKAADRYIGGETVAETIHKVKLENEKAFKCSIEFMGESTMTEHEAQEATEEFINICREIKQHALNATVSLDLSHIGLALSQDLCLDNLRMICREAAKANIEVIISAENADRTDAVLSTYQQIAKDYDPVAITLQAYLHRTKDDFEKIIQLPGRIRLVKGAFETPAGLSLPRGEALDQIYLNYLDRLLATRHRCSIATHDHKIQQEAIKLIQQHGTSHDSYEFESLYGIQAGQLASLQAAGHPTKVYFVYGKEWYLYLCNRLAEYPPNVFQALTDIVG